jgi:predicted DNA-binding transcriptional regulator YafY
MKNHNNAYIRYRALDACFRNRRKRYYIDDLLEAVNEVLYNYNGTSIEERQLYKDIAAMEREAVNGGTDVVIERVQDGKRKFLRYSDPNYSMFEPVISQEEAQLLSDTIQLLSRFKGFPQFDWLDETLARLRQTFQLDDEVAGTVSFQQNPYLCGLKWFGQLFDAIVKKEVVDVTYHHFGKSPRVRTIHPYQLRQSSDRWYLVGYEERLKSRHQLVMLPIDRIDDVRCKREERNCKFREKPEDLDIDDYFYDIVGVSLNPESKPEKIVLKVGYPDAEYLNTKPIHGSQHLLERTEEGMTFEMKLIPNEEFMQQLLTYAHNCHIERPESLRKVVYERAMAILAQVKN